MTVSFLFGWEHVVTALLLVIALAVVFFVMAAAGNNESERAEFQALLAARSNRGSDPELRERPSTGSEHENGTSVGAARAARLPADGEGPSTS
jgi:hypothetical protein